MTPCLKKQDLQPGLNAAAHYLLDTASMFEEMAKQEQTVVNAAVARHGARTFGIDAHHRNIKEYQAKAELLRGQASHILELQK